jgi:hypothetical protein
MKRLHRLEDHLARPVVRAALLSLRADALALCGQPLDTGVRRGIIQLVGAIEDCLQIERTFPSRAERRAERKT